MTRVAAVLVGLLWSSAALAQEIEEHGHGVPWHKLIFSAVNLAIFLYILRRGAWPALRNWAAERRGKVADALAKADRARREAEALRAEWQQRLDHLGAELETMLAQARQDIALERDQILAAARRAAESIRRDAERTAASELRAAREQLRAEVAAQALAIAERLAPQRLTADDQQRFISEFVEQVEQR